MAYELLSGQDIRKLAVDVNAKQNQGFIPAGGISYKDGTYFQFMAPSDIPSPSLYGIVMSQDVDDFSRRAALSPGAPLGTLIQHKSFFIQAFGTAVSDSGTVTIPLAVSNGGTGATTVDAARVNLKIDKLEQRDFETIVMSQNKGQYIFVSDYGVWGAYSPSAGELALGMSYGGTGARDAAGARANLGINTAAAVSNATSAASTVPSALATGATLEEVITTVNALITALTAVRSNSGSSVTQLNALLTSLRASGTMAS